MKYAKNGNPFRWALVALSLILFSVMSAPVYAGHFVVNTTDSTGDINPGDGICADVNGNCSLAAAMQESNTEHDTSTNSLIDLPNGHYVGCYEKIISNITIRGENRLSTIIDGDGCGPIFHVDDFEDETWYLLEISDVTITGGIGGMSEVNDHTRFVGGVIYLEEGAASLTNCVVTKNYAPIVVDEGVMDVISCSINHNEGGGISGQERLALINSEVSHNNGFGVRVRERLHLINSSVTNNQGDGVFADIATITNTTISGNAGTGVRGGDLAIKLLNCTITGNGRGGIGSPEPKVLRLKNTIVAHNAPGGDCTGRVDSVVSLDHNLDSDGTCNLDQAHDLPNTDPLLGEFTHLVQPGSGHFPLLAGSPAIDAASNDACSELDQIGNPRSDGNLDGQVVCDRGAVEAQIDNINDYVTFVPDPTTYSTTPDTAGCPAGYVGKFSFDSTLTNTSSATLSGLGILVKTLARRNLLVTDAGLMGEGDSYPIPQAGFYADGELRPGEFYDVSFTVCLKTRRRFSFFVDVVGSKIDRPLLNPANGHYYDLIEASDALTWYAGRDAAAAMIFRGLQGHLATLTSAAEEDFIIGNFPKIVPAYVWLGAADESTEGDWRWITGEPWVYTNWDPNAGEPNGGVFENCLDYSDSLANWNDESCDRQLQFYLVEYE